MRIDVYHHWHDSAQLDRIEAALSTLKRHLVKMEAHMSQEMDDLEREVQENGSVIDSAVTLIQGLAQQIRDAGADKTKLAALANTLDAQAKALAGAVAANTPAAGEQPGTVNPIP